MAKPKIRYGKRRGADHVSEYAPLTEARLMVGSPCFSGARLKRRFETAEEANRWLKDNPKSGMRKYACRMCNGFHLTHNASKAKRKKYHPLYS